MLSRDADVEALHRAEANDEARYNELSGTPAVGKVHEVVAGRATEEDPRPPAAVCSVLVAIHSEQVRYYDDTSEWWYRGAPYPTLGAATAAVRAQLWPPE